MLAGNGTSAGRSRGQNAFPLYLLCNKGFLLAAGRALQLNRPWRQPGKKSPGTRPGPEAGVIAYGLFRIRRDSRLKASKSSGVRLVTSVSLSTTTSLSKKSAPAFFKSTTIGFTAVIFLPRTASALISNCGPWQMAKIGLPLSAKARVNATNLLSPRSASGECRRAIIARQTPPPEPHQCPYQL